ncbi:MULTISPECIES: allantoate amidohydrolase [unclassified Janthinobacterium]|uniref:allantoate amidohydrolase n=1 Tax=unclassified Janthinobacterium TaxID=2610881 RepID=UPI00047777F2|nr:MULTISPECIES: allantoate amidohydrolase [unclassified Janthinobacterium]MEC5159429.1 hydantoinase/carbamoylase family amidase [Janthinobacterium sp. CG_S6]
MSDSKERNASCGATIMRWAEQLACHSESPGLLTRTYLTTAHRSAAAQLAQWMTQAGMTVRQDAAGNVIGRYEGSAPDAPALLTGSHFDTVRNAGKYDGNLGILLPIACVGQWHQQQRRFPFAIEIVGFAEEEGVRFKATLLGSRAIAGTFDTAVLEKRDDQGQSMREVMAAAGFDAGELGRAAFKPENVLGFMEVHIEQGPVLLDEDLAVGVVTAISGASRFLVAANGLAGHAGTVPMNLRRDAAMAAAEIGLYIEKRCSGVPGLVGTVGQFDVPNGAANTVPGKAVFTIDIRAESDAVRLAAVADVVREMPLIAARRGVTLDVNRTHEAVSVPCAGWLQEQLAGAIASAGLPLRHLPSGAGHDAMAIAALTDVAMLFVRCGNGGISHHPDETMTADDAATAAAVFSRFVEQFSPRK